MIVSRPKITTLISMGIFLALVFFVILYNYKSYFESGFNSTLNLVIMVILFPIGVGLCLKILMGYKIITIGRDRFRMRFPLRFREFEFRLREISFWKETKVKTFNNTYLELEIRSTTGKTIKLSRQEHTEYDKVRSYLGKKCKNKQKQ